MKETFSSYQRFVVALLAFLQFTVVLDFMILSPLGAILIEKLAITPAQFGRVVSVYAFSAGTSGLLSASFADRFDRRKLLLFFYVGFIVGTLLCGLAPTYELLLGARIITGLFGGVIGSIVAAIVTDLFPYSMRGRVMGIVQSAFAASQVLGIPVGLFFANRFGWHAPFLMIVGVGAFAGFAIQLRLRPIAGHITAEGTKKSPLAHLISTAARPRYFAGFAATTLLSLGGFMLMPFGSTFMVQNLGMPLPKLPAIYMVTGFCAMIAGPLLGRLTDSLGKLSIFIAGSFLTAVITLFFTNLTKSSFAVVSSLHVVLFVGISARIVSSFALISALPGPPDRGAFMAINSSLQQLAGGIGSWTAGLLVHQATPTSPIEHYPRLGWVVACSIVITVVLMSNVSRLTKQSPSESRAA